MSTTDVTPRSANAPSACVACGGVKFQERPTPIHEYNYWHCAACATKTLAPQPSEDDLVQLYNAEDYFCNDRDSRGYKNYLQMEPFLIKTGSRRLKLVERQLPPDPQILEIGCGYGYFGTALRDRIPQSQYWGLDVSAEAVKETRRRGFVAEQKSIDQFQPDSPLDLIAFFDVFEHVQNPDLFLAAISNRLRDGGTVLFTTPAADSMLAKISGPSWVSYIAPEHLYLYSRKAIRKVLARHNFQSPEFHVDLQWVDAQFLTGHATRLFGKHFGILSKQCLRPLDSVLVPNGNMLVKATLGSR